MVTKQELLDEMENTDVVRCEMADGYTFEIGVSSNWVGGSENGFMCDFIGNVEYSSKESVVNALFAYLEKEGLEIEEIS